MAYDLDKEKIYGKVGEYQMVSIGDLKMGIPVMQIQEFKDMASLPPMTEIPFELDYVKGLINVRGKVMPTIGLREYKGLGSFLNERLRLIEKLKKIENDHKEWLIELRNCIEENREITVERDPTKCRFGQWHNAYQSDNFDIMAQMLKFDLPHREIHAIADRAEVLLKLGKQKEAIELIDNLMNTSLHTLIELFQELYDMLRISTREILIIIKGYFGEVGIIVDSVHSKHFLDVDDIQLIGIKNDYKLIGKTEDVLMDLFDAENIMLEDILRLLRQ